MLSQLKPKHSLMKSERFIELMFNFFSAKVMKIEKPLYIQFIFFYLCTFKGDLSWIKEAFLETLILNIMDKGLQRQIKLNSLYYLFSFLSCSNFSTSIITFTALEYLLKACKDKYKTYIRKNSYLLNILNCKTSQQGGKNYSTLKHEQGLDKKESGEMSVKAHEDRFQVMLRKRKTETEDTKSIGDDVFIYCL